MDLVDQAAKAVAAVTASVDGSLDGDAEIIARLAWLDGYEAGAKATKQKADEAFAEWQAAQS